MQLSAEVLYQIMDSLPSDDCAAAQLCRHISNLRSSLKKALDARTLAVLTQCLSLCEARLIALLDESEDTE